MLQASADGVAERPFDDGLRGERRGVHLADAGDAGVGGDFDDECVLPAVALRADDFLRDVDGFDVGDFHVANNRVEHPAAIVLIAGQLLVVEFARCAFA